MIKLLKTTLFLSVFVILLVLVSNGSKPAHADSFKCSGVYYQDAGGNVYCINNADSDTDNAVGLNFGEGKFGYYFLPVESSKDLPSGNYFSINNNGGLVPLNGYNGKIECIDNGMLPAQSGGLALPGSNDCQDSKTIGGVVNDPSKPTINSLVTGGLPACVIEHISIAGKISDIVICNDAVSHICADSSYLRAAQSTGDYHNLYFWCDQTSGTGILAAGNVNPDHTPNPEPPQLDSTINSVGYCYQGADGYNFNDGTQILYPSNKSGINLNTVNSHFVNGACVMVSGTGGNLPKNTINCQVDSYYTSHTAECDCISYKNQSANTRIANGNTYTALGCVSSNLGDVINTFLSIAIGIAGIIALIMMMVGGYEIMTNPAGPDEIKEGQQYIVNAILGLLLIIFTVVILRIIGVDILGINELSKLIGG